MLVKCMSPLSYHSHSGALKNDFFEQLLARANNEYFEGPIDRRVPKKDWGMEHNMELTGIMIAHSITQGGPGFPFLCPPVVQFLLTLDRDAAINALPMVTDIPKNLSTIDLLDLLSEVCVSSIPSLIQVWCVLYTYCYM